MAFKDHPEQAQGIHLLQRSLERGRLGHAYLFTGHHLEEIEAMAQALAKTLNCREPIRGAGGVAIDCCDHCLSCRKIDHGNHADVHWVRPESKSRVVTVDQMRQLMQQIHLKSTEAEYKVAVIVAADRLNMQAANAFLKTLEEPPSKSVLILLTTDPQRLLDTILSRCLRMNFAGEGPRALSEPDREWLETFSTMAAQEQKSLIHRYRLLDVLLQKLNGIRAAAEEALTARSLLQSHADADQELREKWEEELTASIEAEYRRQRADLMLVLQRWFRDVWLMAMSRPGKNSKVPAPSRDAMGTLLNFPGLGGGEHVAGRISASEAIENLQVLENTQRLLFTNVQEALALEVGLLKLHL